MRLSESLFRSPSFSPIQCSAYEVRHLNCYCIIVFAAVSVWWIFVFSYLSWLGASSIMRNSGVHKHTKRVLLPERGKAEKMWFDPRSSVCYLDYHYGTSFHCHPAWESRFYHGCHKKTIVGVAVCRVPLFSVISFFQVFFRYVFGVITNILVQGMARLSLFLRCTDSSSIANSIISTTVLGFKNTRLGRNHHGTPLLRLISSVY
jgi:hypothetical protein